MLTCLIDVFIKKKGRNDGPNLDQKKRCPCRGKVAKNDAFFSLFICVRRIPIE